MSLILVSGVASATKSSTPASAAIAAAVSGLSPVIMTVFISILRSSANLALIPGFTMSFSITTPSTLPFTAIASGVAPSLAILSPICLHSSSSIPPFCSTNLATESIAPFLIFVSPKSTPLSLVSALKGISAPSPSNDNSFAPSELARATILRPSGVSSAFEERTAYDKSSSFETFATVKNSLAILLPNVIVPVLSRSSTDISPAVSTALPLVAITFLRSSLSIPAMPIALRSPPIVVGMRQTNNATSTKSENELLK